MEISSVRASVHHQQHVCTRCQTFALSSRAGVMSHAVAREPHAANTNVCEMIPHAATPHVCVFDATCFSTWRAQSKHSHLVYAQHSSIFGGQPRQQATVSCSLSCVHSGTASPPSVPTGSNKAAPTCWNASPRASMYTYTPRRE